MIYLDNAATSYPKPEQVYNEMTRCMRRYCANPGRGGHAMSMESARAVASAREKIGNFFNIGDSMRLCFTKNATEALNIAIKGGLKPGEHVITTSMEHNSVMRPLKSLERDIGIKITTIEGNGLGEIDPEEFNKNIRKNTAMIISTLSSNVNGIIMPVKEIGRIAREKGVMFLLDASQGAGSIPVDVNEMNIDLLAFPGHKGLLGPQGTGGLYVRDGLKIRCLCEGGTGSNSENIFQPEFMPDFLESGTLNTPGIVGLSQGVDFINETGIDKINNHKHKLTVRLMEGIREIKGAILYSRLEKTGNSGIAAANFEGFDSTEISQVLDKVYKTATRAGIHCSPSAHRRLGTSDTGIVRFSPGYFNTIDEIDYVIRALQKIIKK